MSLHRLFLAGILVVLCFTLAGAVTELPPADQRMADSHLSRGVIDGGVEATGAQNLVTAVLFDYRAFDTMGEATVVFAAVAGVVMLFYHAPIRSSPTGQSSLAKRSYDVIGPAAFSTAMYIILYGHISPGGGFQGGVILATLIILVFVIRGYNGERGILNSRFKMAVESSAALLFVVIGFIGIVAGEFFLSNLSAGFPQGTPGTMVSGGAMPILNVAISLKVGAGLALIFYSMVKGERE